ncbi:MAG: ATP-binding domain-containing protein, partial [Lautropia mirabilis]|nr:ATP-binding domain-containing protein [Lautropia mirabilis]
HILDSANHLIRQNAHRLGKDLWTDAGEGEPVRIFAAFSDRDEAQWLLEEIRALVADGMSRSEIAILYRSNAQSRILEHTLFSAGVPYKVYGGLRFFERAEIKHALAYLRLIENPDDDGAFLRVVNFPARGIGARTLENLQDTARTHGISLYRAVPMTSGAGGSRLLQFVMLIELMRQNSARLPLSESIDDVIGRSGLMTHYEQEREGQERIENLKELVNAALAFQAEGGIDAATPASAGLAGTMQPAADGAVLPADAAPVVQVSPLAAFLAHASLESGDGQAEEGVDAVQLMTVHAAKGLEFETVFVTGLEEGLFPHENSASDPGGLEEERRLMYVAMTRARRRLYLSLAQTRMLHGQTRYNMQSRFLSELPERSLKWLSEMPSTSAQGSLGLGADRGSRGYYGGGGYGGGGYGSGNGGGNWRPRLDSAVHERNRQSGWVRPADPGIPASGDASGKARAGRDSRYHIGQSLRHARFGEGVVTGIEGNGDDARIQIRFKAPHGVKWLALAVAKLEPV